jgi:DNA glycosylase AlkZ-like
VWWAYRHYAPLWHHATGGPWSFGARAAYVAARPRRKAKDADTSTQWLVRRYLEGFGPATVQDIAQFSTIYRPPVKEAIAALGDELVRLEGPGGEKLYDIRDGMLPADDAPAPPRLMAMWDSTLLGYADRGRMIPADYRKVVIRTNGDVLPTLLVDGYVAGVWRPIEGGIEATAFHRLSARDWAGLSTEAAALVTWLAVRDPFVYRRYARWWAKMPSAEVRMLAG